MKIILAFLFVSGHCISMEPLITDKTDNKTPKFNINDVCEENIFECKRDCSPSLTANSTGEIDCKFLTRYVYDQKNFIGNRDCSPSLTTNMTPNTGRIPFTRYVYSSFECKKDSSQVSTDFESVDALIENFHNYYDCVLKSKDPNLYKDKYDFICFL